MTAAKSALLLVGSAKQPRSTSESLARHLADGLARHGVPAEIVLLHRLLKTPARQRTLLAKVDAADLVVIAFPLYVDTCPYLVTRALELIAAHRSGERSGKTQALAAIVNCGFPEAKHNDTAIAVCRRFADETGFRWAGGLALGAGESIKGKALAECGAMVRHVIAALDRAAEALAVGEPLPDAAIRLMARPLMPLWLYRLFGELGWQWRAHRNGVRRALKAQPYGR